MNTKISRRRNTQIYTFLAYIFDKQMTKGGIYDDLKKVYSDQEIKHFIDKCEKEITYANMNNYDLDVPLAARYMANDELDELHQDEKAYLKVAKIAKKYCKNNINK
jgi:hypothetical protein